MRSRLTGRLEASAGGGTGGRTGGRIGGLRRLPIASKVALTVLVLVGLAAVFAP